MASHTRKSFAQTDGQLVLVGDATDISNGGIYRLGRIHCVHPPMRNGKEIVRRATVALLKNSGSAEIEYILRDISKIAPYDVTAYLKPRLCML